MMVTVSIVQIHIMLKFKYAALWQISGLFLMANHQKCQRYGLAVSDCISRYL